MKIPKTTRFVLADTAETLEDKPMVIYPHGAGDPIILDGHEYVIVSTRVEGDAEIMVLKPTRICHKCGGIQNKLKPPHECVCAIKIRAWKLGVSTQDFYRRKMWNREAR